MGTPTMQHGGPRLRRDGAPVAGPVPGGRLGAARAMSVVVLLSMTAGSICGLWVTGLYPDPPPVAAMLRAYDLVTLAVAVPALALALVPAWRDTRLAQLVWLSTLGYAVYTYAIYVFGTVFNRLFLLHVSLFALSIAALAMALAGIDPVRIAAGFRDRTPARLIAGMLLVLAVALAGMWVVNALRFAVTGQLPGESYLILPISGVHLAYVLDLVLFAPAAALAGVLLWRRAARGYVLAAVVLLFGTVYQISYLTALLFQTWAHIPGARPFDPAEPVILAMFATATALLLANLRAGPPAGSVP